MTDNDIPTISISSESGTQVSEGDDIIISLTASTILASDLAIELALSQVGSYLAESTIAPIEFGATTNEVFATIETVQDIRL